MGFEPTTHCVLVRWIRAFDTHTHVLTHTHLPPGITRDPPEGLPQDSQCREQTISDHRQPEEGRERVSDFTLNLVELVSCETEMTREGL